MNECMDVFEVKQECIQDDNAYLTFKGWDIKNLIDLVKEEVEDHLECEVTNLKIVLTKEMAYSCSRFCEGTDANDEGHAYWLDYKQTWKKGLGKCTTVNVAYNKKVVSSNRG